MDGPQPEHPNWLPQWPSSIVPPRGQRQEVACQYHFLSYWCQPCHCLGPPHGCLCLSQIHCPVSNKALHGPICLVRAQSTRPHPLVIDPGNKGSVVLFWYSGLEVWELPSKTWKSVVLCSKDSGHAHMVGLHLQKMHIIEKKGAEDGSCSFKYHFDETTWFFGQGQPSWLSYGSWSSWFLQPSHNEPPVG